MGAAHIINDMLWVPGKHDLTNELKIVQDHTGSQYPEVYEAYVQAGGDKDSMPNIAYVEKLGKWGVGFGGKKGGERAAKLALAMAIAKDSDHTPNVVRNYPAFGNLLREMGIGPGMGGGMPGGMGMPGGFANFAGGLRAAPY